MNHSASNLTPSPSPEILERLDIPTLVHRAQVYLDAGHPNAAMPFIRTAVRRAPLRRDLRRLLVMAVEAGADPGEADLAGRSPGDGGPPSQTRIAPPPDGMPIRPTFTRPRSHSASPKLVFLTIAIVTAGVGALILSWTIIRGDTGIQGLEVSAGSGETQVTAGDAEDPNEWILLELQEYESAGQWGPAIERAGDITDDGLRGRTLTRLHTREAQAHEKAGRLESAKAAYENAIAYDADNVGLLKSVGNVLYELGRHRQPTRRDQANNFYEQAEDWLERARVIAPEDTATLLLLARLEIARDDDAGAAGHLRQIVNLAPGSADAERAREILAQRNLRL